jgi:hypothetical protein
MLFALFIGVVVSMQVINPMKSGVERRYPVMAGVRFVIVY